MPVTRMIAALAERLKDDHQQIVPVASLTVIGMNVLDRLERQGMPTKILRSAANDCLLAYLQLNQIERTEFDRAIRAIRAIRRAGLLVDPQQGPKH